MVWCLSCYVLAKPPLRHLDILWVQLDPDERAPVLAAHHANGAGAREWVQHHAALGSARKTRAGGKTAKWAAEKGWVGMVQTERRLRVPS